MPIHERVLEATLRICRERGNWTFRPGELVAALRDLNPASVRTHVMSRCCTNAPSHHPHRWPYFRRVRRGVYEIRPAWRAGRTTGAARIDRDRPARPVGLVVEIRESAGEYRADIPGVVGSIRSSSLDEAVRLVRRIVRDKGAAAPGAAAPVRIHLELGVERSDPVLEAYEKDIDRTLIRQSLRMSLEDRLRALERWVNDAEEIRGAAGRPRKEKER